MSKPLISVIVAVFNGQKTFQQLIDSYAQQSYPNKELIVIDGASSDGTVNLIKSNHETIDYFISEPDNGVYNAWNKGLLQAKGEWICFIGADDYFWDPHVLAKIASNLAIVDKKIRIVYGQIMLLNTNGEPLYLIGKPWQDVKNQFKCLMSVPHPGLMHRRSLFNDHGVFDEKFRIAGDYELLLRELKANDAKFIPNLITVGMRQGGLSSSPSNALEAMLESRYAQKIHGFNSPGVLWMFAIARVYLRILLWRLIGKERASKVLDFARKVGGYPTYWTKL